MTGNCPLIMNMTAVASVAAVGIDEGGNNNNNNGD